MITTTDERMESIEKSIRDLTEAVKPKTTEDTPETEEGRLLKELIAKIETFEYKTKQADEDADTDDDVAFIKSRNNNMFVAIGVTGIIMLVSYYQLVNIFPTMLGILYGLGTVTLGIWIDKVALPGNSMKRIGKNGIASAIFIGAVILSIGMGIQVGSTIITDRYSNDGSRTTSVVRTVSPVEKEIAKPDSTTVIPATED